ncbi:MAG: hypothetical protein KKB34_16800 [Bacteroidetes bacterium]|nr:hypothetical protein [Bacteroidota bacterium]
MLLLIIPSMINAQFYFFGRNKVQYEDFDWKVIKTDHFNIYYYGEFEEMAEIGAKYAEDAYEEYKVKFNHVVSEQIPLIFYNTHIHFQQTNTQPGFIPEGVGGFFEFLKGRVVIPYMGSLAQFEHVIRHELVHVFMVTKIYNIYTTHRISLERFPELWFVEGLAEYWSTTWDSQGEMVMRDAVLNGIFNDLQDMYKVYGSFIMYKAGQKFLEFVSSQYGEDKILALIDNSWRFEKFDDLMEFVLNEKIEEINYKFAYFLKQIYFPLYENKVPHNLQGKQITKEGFNFSPGLLKDEKNNSVFFVGNMDGYSSLYRIDLDSTNHPIDDAQVVVRGEKESVYESFHLLKPSLAVSNNGIVAFVTKSGATDALHFYSASQDKIIKRFQSQEIISIEAPAFSNDNKKLAFTGIDSKGYNDLYTIDIETMTYTRLTNDFYSESEPVFSRNDSSLLFISDRTEGLFKQSHNLFEYTFVNSEITYLTYIDANISEPTINYSTGEIYFTSDNDGVENIWKLVKDENNDPIGMSKVTDFITPIFEFLFIDSNTVLTSAIEKFSFQFYLYNLNESRVIDNKYTAFNFTLASGKWNPVKLSVETQRDRLIYENDYTLDYAVSQVITDPVFGTRGGALLTLSDMLGDDKYLFLIFNTAEVQSEILENFNVAISRVNSKLRTNYGYGVFHFSGRRYDIRESDEFFYERSYGGYFSLVFPFSQFQRIETDISIANSDKELFYNLSSRKALLITNTISFVHDNSIWGPTGPLDGSRFRLMLGYTSDVKYSNVNYYSLIGDYRHYLRLGLRTSLAARASVFFNHGKEARRYFAGGSWDLRGYKRFSIRGEKMWLSSIELRYPLIDRFIVNFPFFGLGFFNVRGALFADAGSAWDTKYISTKGSIGLGIRMNFLNAIIFRYDIGKRIEDNFSSIQNGLFYQFFFGWDF